MPHSRSSLIPASPTPLLSLDLLARVSAAHQDNHVVLWSGLPDRRIDTGAIFEDYLRTLPEVELIVLEGDSIHSLADWCSQLASQLPAGRMARSAVKAPSIDGPNGIVAALREREDGPSSPGRMAKRRYYLWTEAHNLLTADPVSFGGLIDAIAGVAAEAEYASEDLLLIHRAILVGGPELAEYANNPAGQFRSWVADSVGSPPLWKVITGLESPPVTLMPIDAPNPVATIARG